MSSPGAKGRIGAGHRKSQEFSSLEGFKVDVNGAFPLEAREERSRWEKNAARSCIDNAAFLVHTLLRELHLQNTALHGMISIQ